MMTSAPVRSAGGSCEMVVERPPAPATQEPVHIIVRPERRVAWDPSVIDNEHLNRKRSKSLCHS